MPVAGALELTSGASTDPIMGKWLSAAATLMGCGAKVTYRYDFDGLAPEELESRLIETRIATAWSEQPSVQSVNQAGGAVITAVPEPRVRDTLEGYQTLFVAQPWPQPVVGTVGDAETILRHYFADYAASLASKVKEFSDYTMHTQMLILLAGVSKLNSGRYRPVVAVHREHGTLAMKIRLSDDRQLFYELEPDGTSDAVIYHAKVGATSLPVSNPVDLLSLLNSLAP